MIEADWSRRITGLRDQRVETAMMRMPDAARNRMLALSHAPYGRRSPERAGKCPRLPPRQAYVGDEIEATVRTLRAITARAAEVLSSP